MEFEQKAAVSFLLLLWPQRSQVVITMGNLKNPSLPISLSELLQRNAELTQSPLYLRMSTV
jgi:hypothetical protein